jgi:phosphoglycerol transferase MdoB-like AlkP superfamily enzyme
MRVLFRATHRLASNPRVAVPVLLFAGVMLLSIGQRAVVLIGHSGRLATVPGRDLVRSFLVGLRFDAVVAGLISAPLVVALSLAPPSWITRRWLRVSVSAACAALLALTAFAVLADFYFFREFDQRLNHKALVYLDQPYTYEVIWHSYPVIPVFLVTLLVLAGAAWTFGRLAFRKGAQDFHLTGRLVWPAVQAFLLTVAIRGTLGPKAINAGPAYFSNSPTLAQLTLNPLYTLHAAALSMTYRSEDLAEHLPLLPDAEALDLAVQMIVRPQDRLLHDAQNPLRRITDSGKPQRDYNVVLVVLESLSWHYVGAMGGDARLTPAFSALCDEGILMERCFAVGDRTTHGFSGIVAGFPDLPGRSVTTRIEAAGNFLTIGNVLQRRGYETMFVYAGQPMYDHRQSFLRSNGFERMVFEDEFDTRTFRTELGWCDEDLFGEALRQFDTIPADRPFLATMLTLSFHRPFQVPAGRVPRVDPSHVKAHQLDAVRYTDWAVGRFIEQARQKPYFDRTLFVFVADHSGGYYEQSNDAADHRVPFLMYGPKILGNAKRVDAVCSQMDVVPTIMSVLGGSYEHCFFGSSVLDRPRDAGVAIMQRPTGGELSLIDHNGNGVLVPFGSQPRLFRHEMPGTIVAVDDAGVETSARRAALARKAVALLQTANIIFERGAHNVGNAQRGAPASATSNAAAGVR